MVMRAPTIVALAACCLGVAAFAAWRAAATGDRPAGRRAAGAAAGAADGRGAGVQPAATTPAPELFAEGVISTPADETGITFSPDGRTAYFARASATTTSAAVSVICVSRFDRGRWGRPQIAPFSGFWHDSTPALSPDGSRLFFTSDLPVPGRQRTPSQDPDAQDLHIWVVERTATGWSAPHSLGPPIEVAGAHDSAPSPAADGTLYFSSDRPGGKGHEDLYRARWLGRRYATPENLAGINSRHWQSQPAIAPDQSFLVFAGAGRPDAPEGGGAHYPRPHLYVSFRTAGGGWSEPRIFGPPVNSTAADWGPSLTPDGKWLFFSSERGFASVPMRQPLTASRLASGLGATLNGLGNIYRVGSGVIRALARPAGKQTASAEGPAPAVSSPAVHPWTAAGPCREPCLFGEGVVSTPADEFGGDFTRDGATLFFSRSVPRFYLDTIMQSRFENGRWTSPEVAAFSGVWRDYDPVLSPDGSRLFFISDRPRAGRPADGYNIWYMDRRANGEWSAPQDPGRPINGAGEAHFASATRDGTLYFTSNRPGGLGYVDVYRSRWVDGRYLEPENLGPGVNGPGWVNLEAYVFPAGDELIVAAFGHHDGVGDCDLFVSFLRDGVWSPLQNLGPKINSAARDYSPRLTPDGQYLFFASERGLPDARRTRPYTMDELERAMRSNLNGLGNLYLVDVAALPRPPATAGRPLAARR
jgi:Tol biopolymer transport system component